MYNQTPALEPVPFHPFRPPFYGITHQNGDTPLQIAVQYDYGHVTRLLLEYGADPDVVDKVIQIDIIMGSNFCNFAK